MARVKGGERGGMALRAMSVAAACFLAAVQGGCIVAGIAAVAADAGRDIPRTVRAKYTDLEGRNFAVVVHVPRHIQARHPALRQTLTFQIAGRLGQHFSSAEVEEAMEWVPPEAVLEYLFNHPEWSYRPRGELVEALGVERLVFVEVDEFRLVEPGNRYVWDGVASGRVQVYASEAALADEPVYESVVSVRYPDEGNVTETERTAEEVARRLIGRFSDRCAWLFFDHKEPESIPY